MYRNFSLRIFCFVFFSMFLSPLIGQNFFLHVIEKETFYPVQEARVTLESDDTSVVLFTNPRGNVSTNLSPGIYNLIVEKIGYVTAEERILIDDTSIILDIDMKRDVARETRDRSPLRSQPADQQQPGVDSENGFVADTPKPIFKKTSRTTFFDIGYQYGNIKALNLGGGVIYNNIMVSINYARSQQGYQSSLFRSSRTYDVVFNQAAIGVGYDYAINAKTDMLTFFVSPTILGGVEFVNNDRLLTDNSIVYIMNYFVKPQVLVGVNYQRFDFFAGTNYSAWLTSGMTDQRYGMISGDTGNEIKWSDDLFIDRRGFTVVFGVRIYIFNF